MYLQNHIDWSHPLFRRWKLPEKFTKAQSEAFLDANEDEITNTPWTEEEVRSICLNVECRVDLDRGNICTKAEKKWPRTMFKKEKYKDLTHAEKAKLHAKLEARGVRSYNSCVDINQVKRSCNRISRNALDPHKQARFLKRRFYQVMQPDNNPYAVHTQRHENATQEQSEDDGSMIIDEAPDVGALSFLAESEDEILPIEVIEVAGRPHQSYGTPLSIRNVIVSEWIASQHFSMPRTEDIEVVEENAIAEGMNTAEENRRHIPNTDDSIDTVIFTGNRAQQSCNNILSQAGEYSSQNVSGDIGTGDTASDPLLSANSDGQTVEPPANTEVIYTLSLNKLKTVQTKALHRKTNIQMSIRPLEISRIEVTPLERLPVADEYNEVKSANFTQLTQDFQNLDGSITSTQKCTVCVDLT